MQTHVIPAHLLTLPSHLSAPPAVEPIALLAPVFAYLPAPIIPVFTSHPRPLSAYLRAKGMNARPITWPTVPKGRDRIRVCLHYGNSRLEVEDLARAMVEWAREQVGQQGMMDSRLPHQEVLVQSKL